MEVIDKYLDVGCDNYWCENCRTTPLGAANVVCIMCQIGTV